MTLPWLPLPRRLLTNARARMLSLDAVGALMLAWTLADDAGVIRPAADVTAREALVFVVVQHARESADPAVAPASERAVDAVDELLEGGLLIAEGDALRLDGWVALAGAPAPDEAPARIVRKPGRPRKEAPMSPAERKRVERFNNRERGYRDVPTGVTWAQWCAEHPVTETRRRGHENPGPGHENPVTKTPDAPRASGPEEKNTAEKKAEGDSGAPARGHENPGGSFRDQPPEGFRDQPRCPTVEAPPFAVDVLLDRMRAASAGRFSPAAVSTQMRNFGELARELIARGHATPDALVRAAGHAPHVAWVRKLSSPLTVQRLCAEEGRVLVELLAGAEACAACGGAPAPNAPAEEPDDPWAPGLAALPPLPPKETARAR